MYTDIRYVAGLLDNSYTVNEGSGPLEVCVHMISGINQPIDLLLQSTDIFYANDSATGKLVATNYFRRLHSHHDDYYPMHTRRK